ncbi:polysaccharide deacetylase family protein, partial [Streptomyces sp. NPDC058398]
MLALAPLASGCAGTGSAHAPGTGAAAPAHAPGTGVATPARAPRAVLRAGPARALAAQADRLSPAQARRAAAARRWGPAEAPLTLP